MDQAGAAANRVGDAAGETRAAAVKVGVDMGLGKALGKALTARRKTVSPVIASNGMTFFWAVRNRNDEDLDASKHVDLVQEEGGAFLSCKTSVAVLRPVMNEQGQPGIIIYVDDQKSPMVLGTVPYS